MEKSKLQFSNPVLTKLNFELNPEFQPSDQSTVSLVTQFSTKISRAEDSDGIAVISLQVTVEPIDSSISPFRIDAEMTAQFTWDAESLDKALIDILLQQNAPALLLGYLRPIIADITMKSGLPPYQIPFMDFTNSDDTGSLPSNEGKDNKADAD